MIFNDIIVSSRIRLARNLYKTPFPTNKTEKEGERVLDLVSGVINEAGLFELFKMNEVNEINKEAMYERHLISKELIENFENGAVMLNHDETIAIMINEEDHIRQQCILKGDNLSLAYDTLNKTDNYLIKNLQLAFSTKLGFLTSCPTNLGTGMRASIMMFLPALSMENKINELIEALSKLGITIRGVYGEGSVAEGFMYQISNHITLGLSEEEIISKVNLAVEKITNLEKNARIKLLEEDENEIKDMVFRAYGILSNCHKISTSEFMKLLAQVKLGVSLGLISFKDQAVLDRLLELAKPATLMQISGKDLNANERDLFRANYLHKKLINQRL